MRRPRIRPVIPAKAGISLPSRTGIPAFAGMTGRWAVLTPLLLLAACGRDEPAANNQSVAAPRAPVPPPRPEGAVGAAERLVRERLGNPRGLTFSNPRRGAGEGVAIVCGDYEQGGARHRYIVVGGQDVFVEPRMRPGEMDRAFAEFCGDGERG